MAETLKSCFARFAILTLLAAMLMVGVFTNADASESKYLRRVEANKTVIVFVHGLGGDSDSTWKSGQSYWPKLLEEDLLFNDTNIYAYEYPTRLTSETMSIDELAEDMRIRLKADGVSTHLNIVFVAHSMGGILVRAYLLKNTDVVARTRFSYFLATPALGSGFASIASAAGSKQLQSLKEFQSKDYLAEVARQWRGARMPFPTYCAYEKRRVGGKIIVEESSATHLCDRSPDPIDADHFGIAKPLNRKAAQYQALSNAFKDELIAPNPKSALSFQYARLFGALEIPLLMELLPDLGFKRSPLGGGGYVTPRNPKLAGADIRKELATYVSKLPFSSASPLIFPIWKDVAGSEAAATSIAWRATAGNREERACLLMEPLVDGGSQANAERLGALLPKNWQYVCPRRQEVFDRRVGFTFLIIENVGKAPLRQLSLNYRENYSENKVEIELHDRMSIEKLKPAIRSTPNNSTDENLLNRFGTSVLIENLVLSRPIQQKYLEILQPGEKLILLLNIYFANDAQLPAGYLYGIYMFESIDYRLANETYNVNVRAPYQDKAARQLVPYGWFNQ